MNFHRLIATGFGTGLLPWAPGTCGSIGALFAWMAITSVIGPDALTTYLILIVTAVAGTWSTREYLALLRTKGIKDSDPKEVVIDEWLGLFITLRLSPHNDLSSIAVAFLAFRLFDILKPGPVGLAERLPNEHGIMGDDIVAGFLAALTCQLLALLIPLIAQ